MTGGHLPPLVVELAEQINHLAVQNDAREFRLELMIEDLLAAQASLVDAKRNALTGLPNRGLLHKLFTGLRRRCDEVSDTCPYVY